MVNVLICMYTVNIEQKGGNTHITMVVMCLYVCQSVVIISSTSTFPVSHIWHHHYSTAAAASVDTSATTVGGFFRNQTFLPIRCFHIVKYSSLLMP
jgi:hypothetical protein